MYLLGVVFIVLICQGRGEESGLGIGREAAGEFKKQQIRKFSTLLTKEMTEMRNLCRTLYQDT